MKDEKDEKPTLLDNSDIAADKSKPSGDKKSGAGSSRAANTKREKKDDSKKDDDKQEDSELDDPIIKDLFSGLEGAAFQSRMPFDKLTSTEAACFPGKNFLTIYKNSAFDGHVATKIIYYSVLNYNLSSKEEKPREKNVRSFFRVFFRSCLLRIVFPFISVILSTCCFLKLANASLILLCKLKLSCLACSESITAHLSTDFFLWLP